MKEEITTQSCKNCRYFIQYYAKGDSRTTHFLPVNSGVCLHHRLTPKEKTKFPFEEGCSFWETIEIQKAERKEKIINVLRAMEKHLADIAIILNQEK